MQLGDAQAKLDAAEGSADLTEAVTSPGIIRGVTEPFRQAADASVSQAQAQVDALQAQISQAQSQAQTPPADTSPELEAAQRDVQAAKTLSPRHRCASTSRRRPSTRSIDLPLTALLSSAGAPGSEVGQESWTDPSQRIERRRPAAGATLERLRPEQYVGPVASE
jgi:hypothetical protein